MATLRPHPDLSTIAEQTEVSSESSRTPSSAFAEPENFPSQISQLTDPSEGYGGPAATFALNAPSALGNLPAYFSEPDEESYYAEGSSIPAAAPPPPPPPSHLYGGTRADPGEGYRGFSVGTTASSASFHEMTSPSLFTIPASPTPRSEPSRRSKRRWIWTAALLCFVLVLSIIAGFVVATMARNASSNSNASSSSSSAGNAGASLEDTLAPVETTTTSTTTVPRVSLPTIATTIATTVATTAATTHTMLEIPDFPLFPVLSNPPVMQPATSSPASSTTTAPSNGVETGDDGGGDPGDGGGDTCPQRPTARQPTLDGTILALYRVSWFEYVERGSCYSVTLGSSAQCSNEGSAVLYSDFDICRTQGSRILCSEPPEPGDEIVMGCSGLPDQVGLTVEIDAGTTMCVGAGRNEYFSLVTARCNRNGRNYPFICPNGPDVLQPHGIPLCGQQGSCDVGRREEQCELAFDGARLFINEQDEEDAEDCRRYWSMSRGEGEPCEFDLNCASGICANNLCRVGPGCTGADCAADHHCQSNQCLQGNCV